MNNSLILVRQLVEDFKLRESAFLSPAYQESQVRQDFIDKFFTALGWDVTHERQKNPYEQEVKIENKVSVSGSQRRADYAFSLAPNFRSVKFFVEAKKPSRNLANADDYYQTIRYGWNQGTPLAVLTDFEEFHILDCRYKPDIKTSLDRKIESFHYSDYADAEKFAHIFHLFGREAVGNGSLEKFIASRPKPKGKTKKGAIPTTYQQVDESFLELLDGYRESLAKEFKNNNQQLDGEELTEAVQRTLDRLVFIRFLEDKSIEEPSIIGLSVKPSAWNAFSSVCRSLEPKYNGLVFKQHRVIDSEAFVPPDNDVFGAICAELSDPASPYDFDKIPISILGSIYERFLGKVVSATEKRAKVEEKPEVRKAGGVYYTPEYIVRYIVKETVGKLIEGKTPAEIAKMAFADIACGSGSFLLEVYGTLLDYHTRWYNEHLDKVKKGDTETRDGKLVLSLKKRQEILTNNIYGVDIDAQAYEVTQVSLYLKLLEEATMNEGFQFTLLKEKLLPDLKENIICGNSLIERDILVTDEEEQKLKPMNFADAFPEIMRRGGFDAIVGNPPYIRIQAMTEFNPLQVELLKKRYKTASKGNYDIYVVFVERGLSLLNNKGYLGYILPHKFLNAQYGEPLRDLLSKGKHLSHVVHFGDQQVFDGATTYTCLLFLQSSASKDVKFVKVDDLDGWRENGNAGEGIIPIENVSENEWNFTVGESSGLFEKLRNMPVKLGDLADRIFQGLVTGADPVFIVENENGKTFYSENTDRSHKLETELLHPLCKGSVNIRRYMISEITKSILFPYKLVDGKAELLSAKELSSDYPQVWEYLKENRSRLESRERGKWKNTRWYAFGRSQNLSEMEQKKILTPSIANCASFTLDSSNAYYFVGSGGGGGGGYGITLKASELLSYEYVLGLLNSKLLDLFLKSLSTSFRGGYYAYNRQYIEQLPIRAINFSDPADKSRHDQIVKLVEQMLAAKEKLAQSKTDAETHRLEAHCTSLDRQIDAAVYELYGLTEEEIVIVEGKEKS
jgi:type I restriction-modification system DNA methylase subunit